MDHHALITRKQHRNTLPAALAGLPWAGSYGRLLVVLPLYLGVCMQAQAPTTFVYPQQPAEGIFS